MSALSVIPSSPVVQVTSEGDCLRVELGGRWHITESRPSWVAALAGRSPKCVQLAMAADIGTWDSALLLFVHEVRQWCRATTTPCDLSALPEAVRRLMRQFTVTSGPVERSDHCHHFVMMLGLTAEELWMKTKAISNFVGEGALSAASLAKRPRKFRWRDCLEEMQSCGAMALPIVGLISLLIGIIMAYQSAVLMRQFGADIYVADAVGLVIVRELGPMITAMILAGRTGAAFAATLGNMKANEEIDALVTLGIKPVDFLVMPRLVALALMMPLLALYANALGVIGGMVVSLGLLHIPPAAYWVETQSAIDLSDVFSGLIKAATFGLLVGLAGCHCGLQAERSAAGVGRAATSAVVTGLLLIITADAVFAVLFHLFGL